MKGKKQLLANSSFEFGIDKPEGWIPVDVRGDRGSKVSEKEVQFIYDKSTALSGMRCVGISIKSRSYRAGWQSGRFPVEKGKVYALSGWTDATLTVREKSNHPKIYNKVSIEDAISRCLCFLYTRWFDKDRKLIGPTFPFSKRGTLYRSLFLPNDPRASSFINARLENTLRKRRDWKQVGGTFVAPGGARFAEVICMFDYRYHSQILNYAWFDDISLIELDGLPPAKIDISLTKDSLSLKGMRNVAVNLKTLDQEGNSLPDGTVVKISTSTEKIVTIAKVRDRRATAVLVCKPHFGEFKLTACCGGEQSSIIIKDKDSAIIMGKIYDSKTGKSLAARVKIQCSNGEIMDSRYPKWPGFWVDGKFRKSVPFGRTKITVCRGIEYEPFQWEKDIIAKGGKICVEFALKKRVNMRAKGWYSGENHFHTVHGQNLFEVDIPYAALVARGEGLDYANLGPFWDNSIRWLSPEKLSSLCNQVSKDEFTAGWNLEFPKSKFGHCWSLNVRSYGKEYGKDDIWLKGENYEGYQIIHKNGGIVICAHPLNCWISGGIFCTNLAATLPFDTLAGPLYDGIDVLGTEKMEKLWYMLLNKGYKIPGVTATDACLDRPSGPIPGINRLYSYVEGKFSMNKVAQAIKQGRNFVTNGPFILFSIGKASIGDVLIPTGKVLKARIETYASAEREDYLSKVLLIRNGKIVREWKVGNRTRTFKLRFNIKEDATCWYIAKCVGANEAKIAFTNPIYFISPSAKLPQPLKTNVHGRIYDLLASKSINANVQIYNNGSIIKKIQASKGEFEVRIAPTAKIKVSHPGYMEMKKSIFRDTPIFSLLTDIMMGKLGREDALLDWQNFEKARELMENVNWEFPLRKLGVKHGSTVL